MHTQLKMNGAAIVLILSASLNAQAADELDARFKQLATGLTRSGAVALMGRAPDAETTSTTLGVMNYERLRWNSAGRAFVVKLLGGGNIESRVVGTASCLGTQDC